MCMCAGGAHARQLPAAVAGAHAAGGRGQRALDAGGADGQLPGVPEAYDAAAARDRVAAGAPAHVRQPLQDRQGTFFIFILT